MRGGGGFTTPYESTIPMQGVGELNTLHEYIAPRNLRIGDGVFERKISVRDFRKLVAPDVIQHAAHVFFRHVAKSGNRFSVARLLTVIPRRIDVVIGFIIDDRIRTVAVVENQIDRTGDDIAVDAHLKSVFGFYPCAFFPYT